MAPSVSAGWGPRLQVDVDDHHVPGLCQHARLDQIHMGDLGHLLLQVAVIFNVDATLGDHGGGSLGLLGVLLRHRQLDVGPFHIYVPPVAWCYFYCTTKGPLWAPPFAAVRPEPGHI